MYHSASSTKTSCLISIREIIRLSLDLGWEYLIPIQNSIAFMDKNNENSVLRLEITVKRLKSKLKSTQKQLDNVSLQLTQTLSENEKLQIQLSKFEQSDGKYYSGWSWISKIVFIVTNANKPLRSVEIIALLLPKEPVLKEKLSKEKFISAFLNVAMQHQRLMPYKLKGVRGNYYCLPEWINEKNELLPEMRTKIY